MNTDQSYTKPISATEKCEHYLSKVKKSNIEKEILPSENKVIDRILNRTLDMTTVYEELVVKYTDRQYRVFIDVILSSAAFWNPDKAKKYRKDKADLLAINNSINQQAKKLTEALSKRENLINSTGFGSDTFYHILDVIDAASKGNGHYTGFLSEQLKSLSYDYDLKYWPSLSSVVKAIAIDSEKPDVQATDPLTDAATKNERTSLSDFLRALFASIEENTSRVGNGLPDKVKVTDSSLAIIVNCSLGLDIEEMVDSSYVKGVRQRLRNSYDKNQ